MTNNQGHCVSRNIMKENGDMILWITVEALSYLTYIMFFFFYGSFEDFKPYFGLYKRGRTVGFIFFSNFPPLNIDNCI